MGTAGKPEMTRAWQAQGHLSLCSTHDHCPPAGAFHLLNQERAGEVCHHLTVTLAGKYPAPFREQIERTTSTNKSAHTYFLFPSANKRLKPRSLCWYVSRKPVADTKHVMDSYFSSLSRVFTGAGLTPWSRYKQFKECSSSLGTLL